MALTGASAPEMSAREMSAQEMSAPEIRASQPAAAVDVVGDDAEDAFIGTGALLLPASVDDRIRREVADCPGCRWRLTSPCVDTELGNAFDGQQSCQAAPSNCPDGMLRRTWHDPGTGTWRNLGLVCIRERVHTVATMGWEIRSLLRQDVPEVELASLPTSGVVTQMPTFFTSRQGAGPVSMERNLGGFRVRVEARPTWTWDFGDGSKRVVHQAGTLRSGADVVHTYRRAGRWPVTCRVVWEAEFTVDGLGPFPVTNPVRQVAHRQVEVGEGRALLTP